MLRASTVFAAAAVVAVRSASALATPASATSATSSSTSALSKYQVLTDKLAEIEKLSGIKGLLGWDEMAMMAPGSAAARNDQKSALSGVIYERQTAVELEHAILDASSVLQELPSAYERAVVRDAQRDHELTRRKSKDMAVRETELEGRGYQVRLTEHRAVPPTAHSVENPHLRRHILSPTGLGRRPCQQRFLQVRAGPAGNRFPQD